MTQVQTMTNPELNRALAEKMGWTEFKEDGHGGTWAVAPDFRWTNKMPDYCTDPAASLEVQTAAIAKDALGYVQALADVMVIDIRSRTLYSISRLINASPRERAEAAYITLQGQ